jgi:hypothetical protein
MNTQSGSRGLDLSSTRFAVSKKDMLIPDGGLRLGRVELLLHVDGSTYTGHINID